MKWLTIPYVLILVICFVLGINFAMRNLVAIPLDLFGHALPVMPVSLWIMLALMVGALLGIVFTYPLVFSARRKSTKTQKQLLSCQKELDKVRTMPLSER